MPQKAQKYVWNQITDNVWNQKLSILDVDLFMTPADSLHVALGMSSKSLLSKVAKFLYKLPKTDPVFMGTTKQAFLSYVKSPSFSFSSQWIPVVGKALLFDILFLNSKDYSMTFFKTNDSQKTVILLSDSDYFSLLGYSKNNSDKVVKCSFKESIPTPLTVLFDPHLFMSMHIKSLINCDSKNLTINDILKQFLTVWTGGISLPKDETKAVIKIIRSHLQSLSFFC